jgi:type IV pilus assembly protein PilM
VAKRFVSIDIGAKFIKLVEASISGSAINIVDIIEREVDPETVKSVLKDMLKEKKVESDVLISLISRKFASVRVLNMPKLKPRKLRQIIPYEMEPNLAVPIEEVSVDFLAGPSEADERGQKVLAAAIPKKVIKEHIEFFEDVGIEPGRIDLDTFALIKGIDFLLPVDKHKTLICLDVGHEKISLNILKAGAILYSRVLFKAFYHIIQEIKKKYNFDEESENQNLFHMLEAKPPLKSLTDIIDEIKLSIKIYLANPENEIIDALLITGGGIKVEGLKDYISREIEIPLLDLNYAEEKKDFLSSVFALGGAIGGY